MIVSPIRAPIRTPIAAAMRQRRGSVLGALGSALEAAGYTGSYWYPGGYSGATLAGGLAWGTMFQDSTGATPVTALEQSVGFRADRRYLENPVYGANVWNNATAAVYGESQIVSSGVFRLYSSAGTDSGVWPTPVDWGGTTSITTPGALYVINFTIDSVTTAGNGIKIGSSGSTVLCSPGRYERCWVAETTSPFFKRVSGAVDVQISNVSVKLVTLPASVYGADVVVNGTFATDTVWTKGTGWGISGGIATHSGAPSGDLVQAGILTSGKTYEITAVTTVGAVTTFLAGTNSYATTAAGVVKCLIVANGADLTIRSATAGSTVDSVVARELKGTHLLQATSTARGTVSAAYTLLANASANTSLATQNVTTLATTYRLYFTGGGTVTLSGTATGAYTAGTHTITCTAGTLTLTVSGSVLTPAFWLAAYNSLSLPLWQRRGVTTATVWDYDCTGTMADGSAGVFPCYIRRTTDDTASPTKTIDLTGTDEVFVGYGGLKESDAAAGTVFELGTDVTAVNGTFALHAPVSNATTDYGFAARGTTTVTATATGHTAPKVAAIAGYADISTPATSITVNGVTTTSASSLGTGNFANLTAYESRAGTSRWPNDRCYYVLAVDARATTAASRAALTSQLARDLMKLSY